MTSDGTTWTCWFWRYSERQLDLVQSLPAAHPRYCGPVSNKQHPATEKLQRLLNASTHLVNDMRKFDHSVRQFMHVDLHWLDMPERVKFKLVSMCITAFITRLPGTWRNTTIPISDVASPVDDMFVLPGIITSLCLDTVSARMGVEHLLLPAQLPGTHWAMICMIWRLALTVSDVCLKLGCFQRTSIYSATEVSIEL